MANKTTIAVCFSLVNWPQDGLRRLKNYNVKLREWNDKKYIEQAAMYHSIFTL